MNVDDFVIINDMDKPCVKLLMMWDARTQSYRYLNKNINNDGRFKKALSTGSLADFGFEYDNEAELFKKTKPSTLTYSSSGKTREWQGVHEFSISDILFERYF